MIVNPFVTGANQIKNTQTLQTAQAQTLQIQTSNPLLDEEEFDITVANIKHDDIKVSITIDGLKNSTIIPGNPPDVILPTSARKMGSFLVLLPKKSKHQFFKRGLKISHLI